MGTLIVLNCATLGPNELDFWREFADYYGKDQTIVFFSTKAPTELPFEFKVELSYDHLPSLNFPNKLEGNDYPEYKRIAELDKIWDTYDPQESDKKVFFWYQFWQLVVGFYRPKMTFLWNGYHIAEATLYQTCKNHRIKSYFLERGPFANTFTCDEFGYNFSSSFIKNYCCLNSRIPNENVSAFRDSYFSREISNWEQADSIANKDRFYKKFGLPSNKLVLFMPGQLDRDSNMKINSPNYFSFFEAAEAVVKALYPYRKSVFLLGKQHPKDKSKQPVLKRLFSKVGKWVSTPNIFDCIRYSDAIISVNSSSAVEGALFGKPILILGNSILFYNKKILNLRKPQELDERIETLIKITQQGTSAVDFNFFGKLFSNVLYSTSSTHLNLGLKSIMELPNSKLMPSEHSLSPEKLKIFTDWLNFIFRDRCRKAGAPKGILNKMRIPTIAKNFLKKKNYGQNLID